MGHRRKSVEPIPTREIVPGILRSVRTSGRGAVDRVRTAWPGIVGEAVARRTRIAAVAEGMVRVEVASAALKHDLSTFRREEVLDALRRGLPDLMIREISYRVGAL